MTNSNTLKYIAEKLNISISTVSRAVNNKSNVNEKTRQKVLKALEEFNYIPNDVARSLQSKATNTIGIIIPDLSEVFFGQVIKGIDEVVFKNGYMIIVADSCESKEKEEKYLDMLFQKRVDALVLATVDLKAKKVLQYLNNGIPVVFIDNLPTITQSIDAVMIDNMKASSLAVNHLLDQGHRDIAVIIGSIEETTGYDRLSGYKLALHNAGIEINEKLIEYGNYKEDQGFECMQRLIDGRGENPFTAVYATSEMMTFGAIKALQKNGLRIPEDISLIGFDVHDKAGLVSPAISTIRQPETMVGKQAGELLIKRLKEKENSKMDDFVGQRILLDPILETKQSCRKISR